MPESVTDRPASALEYVFLLTKNSRYFFDMEAIRKKFNTNHSIKGRGMKGNPNRNDSGQECGYGEALGRNYRNTDLFFESIKPPHGLISAGDELLGLYVNPQALKEAHFASFPFKLVEPLIKAGSSGRGCCPKCGSPWERGVERKTATPGQKPGYTKNCTMRNDGERAENFTDMDTRTLSWSPTCSCNAGETIPCTILDIFFGSGTVAVVAERLGRKWVGIELSKDYIEIAKNRIEKAADPGAYKQAEVEQQTGQANLFKEVP